MDHFITKDWRRQDQQGLPQATQNGPFIPLWLDVLADIVFGENRHQSTIKYCYT